MADYFPLISRAIKALPEGSTLEQREEIYERARNALGRQLSSVEPSLPAAHIERERAHLEDAVSRLEAQLAQDAADALNEELVHERDLVEAPVSNAETETEAPPEFLVHRGTRLQAPPDLQTATQDPSHDRPRRPRVPFAGEDEPVPVKTNTFGIVLAAGLPIMIGLAVAAYILRDDPNAFQRPARPTTSIKAPSSAAASQPQPLNPAPSLPPPEPVLPVAVRASLYEEDKANPQRRVEIRGAVIWRVEPDTGEQGSPASLRIRADIELPDEKLNAEFIVRRNTDPSFPASHTLSLRFIPVGDGAPTVKSVSLPEFREDLMQKGPVLQGGNVPVQDNEFLVALLNGEPVQSTNIDLLKKPGWLYFELRLADGRRSELVFEKGVAGERAFEEAFTAWGQ